MSASVLFAEFKLLFRPLHGKPKRSSGANHAERGEAKGPQAIVINTDPYPSIPHGGTRWGVAVPDVSDQAEVVEKHSTYVNKKACQRAS